MAIDFNLINTQGGAGLPNFVPDIKRSSGGGGGQSALAQQLALNDDARAQEMHEAKLAKELLTTDLLSREDSRADKRLELDTRKTDAGIANETNLTNANVNKINQGILLDWNKFEVDTDIKYKDYGLREREQNFTEGLRNKQFGQQVKESEHSMGLKDKMFSHTVNMDERTFQFNVDKYNNEQEQQKQYKQQLAEAVNQGSAEVVNTLIRNGNIDGAAKWQDTVVNAYKNGVNIANPEEEKKNRQLFAVMAPDVLSTGKLSQENADKWLDLSMAPEQAQQLKRSGKSIEAATVSWLAANQNNLAQVGLKDPGALIAHQNGWGPPPKLPDAQEKDRSDFLSGNYNKINQAKELDKQFALLDQVLEIQTLASGAADPAVMGVLTDTLQAFNTSVKGLTGFESKQIASLDDAFETAEAIKKALALNLATQQGEGNDPKANARMFANIQGAMDGGRDSIRAFKGSLGIDNTINNGYITAAIAETNPSLNVGQLRQNQLIIENEISKLERKAGRSLTLDEKIKYINMRGQ